MTLRYLKIGALAAAMLAGPWAETGAVAQDGVFIPTLVYRTGPYAPNGIPIANGFKDYFTLLNERDGGIEGVKIIHEECETQYDQSRAWSATSGSRAETRSSSTRSRRASPTR